MTQKIKALSEQTINQIAAGEVIENPASVVKELIENAVDAEASQIVVTIMGGGHQLIRVSDDGTGMGREDALMCLERHATSKITKVDDLIVLGTMGFRGEALASIASVSKMRIVTAEEGVVATEVELEGGKILHVGEAARSRGTTIEIRSLFYNVPARKKFQKSAGASVAEVTKVVTQQALAHPELSFQLIVQERTVFSVEKNLQGDPIAVRSAQLLGGHFETDVFQINLKQGDCRLKGVVGSPLAHRHNRTGQHLFINRRPVVSPLISYAIRDAYGTRLPSDRHPIFSLHIEIPSYLVDVNVHPQKKEIRLRDERGIRESIQMAVQLALQQPESPIIPMQQLDEKLFLCEEAGSCPPSLFCAEQLPAASFREEPQPSTQEPLFAAPAFRPIGIFSHYLILDSQEEEMILIDLMAAQARIAFDRMVSCAQTDHLPRQGLLIPEVLAVSADEEVLIHCYEKELTQIGFEIRQCGKSKFMIDAVPAWIDSSHVLDVVRTMLTELVLGRSHQEEKMRRLAQVASRFAGGRKKMFMIQEASGIFQQLMQTSSPYFCPKGRSTMVHMSQDEIEKKFFTCH